MQVPSPDSFRHEDGYWVGPPWWATIRDACLDLFVSDWDGAPDPESLAFGERVLPRVDELRANGVRYITDRIQVSYIPRMEADNAELVAVFCDAGSRTVVVEMSWEIDMDHLWWVELVEHPVTGFTPVSFGMRGRGQGGRPTWRPPYRSTGG